MQWIACLRAEILENSLQERLDQLQVQDPWRPVEVLTPTAILADHLRLRLAADRSRLGVEVRTLHAFAQSRLASGGVTKGILPRHARLDLLRLSGGGLRKNVWVEHAGRRSGTTSAVLQRIDELRESGISPDDAAAEARSEVESAFVHWYRAYLDELTKQAPAFTDEAGLIEACVRTIEADPPETTILIYGAYEFVGSTVDLLSALDRMGGITVFLPLDPESEASRATLKRLESSFGTELVIDALSESTCAAAVPARGEPVSIPPAGIARVLFDAEPAGSGSAAAKVVPGLSLRNVNGAAHEIDAAIRDTERWIGEGIPAREIIWVTRDPRTLLESLADRWAPWINGDPQMAFRSSTERPLLSDFRIAVWWRLIEAVAAGYPRAETVALLSDPRPTAMHRELSILPADVQQLDRMSRERSIFGGADEYRDEQKRSKDILERTTDPEKQARRRQDLRAWELATRFCRFWNDHFECERTAAIREHLDRLVSAFEKLFPQAEATDTAKRLSELAGELALYERWRPQPVTWKTCMNRLRAILTDSGLPRSPGNSNAIHVLEARQARGIPTRHTIILGMQAGVFPRNPPTDGILDEPFRERLRLRCSRPLAGREETAEEEKTLFATLLGGATGSVTLSWQREDDKGGVLLPSPWIGRLRRSFGRRLPVDSTPTHPATLLKHVISQGAPILMRERWCLRALQTADPKELLAAASERSDLQPGLIRLVEIESFTGKAGRFDGRLSSPPPLPASWSVSRVGSLASCPLRWWGEEVLGVSALDPEPDRVSLPRGRLGSAVHRALQDLYQGLFESGLLWKADARMAAVDQLPAIIARAFTAKGLGDRRLAPGVGPLLRGRWGQAVLERLESDLDRHAGEVPQKLVLESSVERTLRFGDHRELTVRGRFDLEQELASGEREVVDYKTSKSVKSHLQNNKISRLEKTQAPLYSRLSDEAAVVFFPVHPGLEPDDRVAETYDPTLTDGCIKDLARVFDVIEEGHIPWLDDDSKRCGEYCAIRDACRRSHPPTLAREQASGDRARVEGWNKRNYTGRDS